ncbi:hypothetical protein AN639_02830 [Candidatus Epulonipiscium fishelsonii]|nr:hypothetical protein AN639_02830 [Epulopiscium sp. SCG-B05WGA-EpuloA1]
MNKKSFLTQYIMYFALIIMCVVLTLLSDKFLTASNMLIILKQMSIQSIVAIGMTMIIISGNIDLSVGSTVAFCSVCGALLMTSGVPIIIAMILMVLIGGVFGLISGGVTAKLNLHSFLVTLALMQAVRGMAQTLTGGYPKAGLPEEFGIIATGEIMGIPYLIIIMIVFYVVFIYILEHTEFGRSIYAVGSNAESARLSGINVEKVKTMVFVISSALCGVASIMLTAKVRSGDPTAAVGWEMDAIAGAIIGGTNMAGGEGKLWGTIIGLLFVGILGNGMVLLGVSAYTQTVIKGLVIFLAVIINSIQKRSAA